MLILISQLDRIKAEGDGGSKELKTSLAKMERLLSLPLSVYFNASREQPYTGGGEEYLVRQI